MLNNKIISCAEKKDFHHRSLGCGVRILDFWTMELSLLEGDEGLVAAQVVSCCVSKIKNIEETIDNSGDSSLHLLQLGKELPPSSGLSKFYQEESRRKTIFYLCIGDQALLSNLF